MAQELFPDSDAADVEPLVRQFIVTDPDGSQRLQESEFVSWLAGQLSAYITDDPDSRPNDKYAAASACGRRLSQVINRESWAGRSDFPNVGGNEAERATARLIQIKEKLELEKTNLEMPYITFATGLAARTKILYQNIVAPTFPPGVEIITSTRVYVETFVTDWDEESEPSVPTALVSVDGNDTVTFTGSAPPVGRNVTKRRVYRSATGTQSSAYKMQGEYPIATTTIVDSKTDELLADVCPTFGWLEPPAGLQCLTGMPNGMMLGFVGRTLYACEPYHPYAYPAKYDKPLAHDIVGLVAVGQSAFIGTTGRPYFLSGSDSASLTEELISSKVPCASANSMVAIKNSVFYASPDGLALYEGGAVSIITKGIMDRKTWQTYNPSTMRAGEFDGMYMVFYTKAGNVKGCLVFDYENRTLCDLNQAADAVFSNEDGVYILNGTSIYDLMPVTGNNRTGAWRSKTFRTERPQSFLWIHVDSDFLNNGTPVSATLRIYADGVLHHTATVSSAAPVRNKPGYASDWRFEIDCAAVVNGIVLATTTEELKAAS
jgi:hypothetical protein